MVGCDTPPGTDRRKAGATVFVDDIGERNTADWPEPAHEIADRQQGIRMDAGRQSESGLRFPLDLLHRTGSTARNAERQTEIETAVSRDQDQDVSRNPARRPEL